jgi:hypothetical protein
MLAMQTVQTMLISEKKISRFFSSNLIKTGKLLTLPRIITKVLCGLGTRIF